MADQKIDGSTSDGFHTFDELYHHRTTLFMIVCSQVSRWLGGPFVWKARVHADGTMFEGFFIAGIDTPYGPATYHVREEYWDRFPGSEAPCAPWFDGHTPEDTLDRLTKMIISTDPMGVRHG